MAESNVRSFRFGKSAQVLFGLSIIGFLIYRIRGDAEELMQYNWEVKPLFLTLSYLGLCSAFLVVVMAWRMMLKRLGFSLNYLPAFRIWFRSNFARYLPGRVWGVLSMLYMCEKKGMPRSLAVMSGVLIQIFSLFSVFALGLMYMATAPGTIREVMPISDSAVLIAIGLFSVVLVISPFFTDGTKFVLRRLRKTSYTVDIRVLDRLAFFFLFTFIWLLYGASFGFFVFSVSNVPQNDFMNLVPIFPVAYTLGFVSLLTPGGIGVREGVMTFLLLPYLPVSVAGLIALAARIWMTLGELFFFVIAHGES